MSEDKLYVSEERLGEMCYNLADKISEKEKNLSQIVCVNRGGLVLGRYLSDALNLELGIISAQSYEKGEVRRKRNFIYFGGFSSMDPLEGHILLVDDLVDGGLTLKALHKYFSRKNEVSKVTTAVLFKKPKSVFIPDYYLEETDKWVVFPYEKREFNI